MVVAMAVAWVGAEPALAAPTWLAPAVLAPAINDPVGGTQSAVAVNAAGDAVVVFTRYLDGGTASAADDKVEIDAVSRPAGGSFGAIQTVSTQANGTFREVGAAIDDAGNALAVFTTYNATNIQVQAANRPPGGAWTAPRDVTGVEAGNDANGLRVKGNGRGDVALYWQRTAPLEAHGAVGTITGPITALATLNTAPGVFTGTVAIDAAGDVSWVWERDVPSAPGGQYVIDVRDRPAGGALGPVVHLTPEANGALAEGPDVALDPSGRGVIVYGYRQTSGTPVTQQVRYSVRTALSSWGSGSWSTDVRTASQAGQTTMGYGARVVLAPDGTATLGYSLSDVKPWSAVRTPGQAFSGFQALSDSVSSSQTLAVGADGTVVAMFTTSAYKVVASVRPAGASAFGSTQDIDDLKPAGVDYGYAGTVGLALDGAGDAFAGYALTQCGPGCGAYTTAQHALLLDAGAPQLRSLSVPASATVGSAAAFSVSPFDVVSAVTATWDFGDGTSAAGGSVSHAYAAPGSYAVKVTATDATGKTATESRTVTAAFADADGDGSAVNVDCDDANPAVHPGAVEVAGNGIDDDCAGGDAAALPGTLGTTVKASWKAGKRRTSVKSLGLRGVEAGSITTVRCAGRGCPFETKVVTAKKAAKSRSLTGLFNRRVGKRKKRRLVVARLRPGTVVTVEIALAGKIGRFATFTTRKDKAPKASRGCVAPGTTTHAAC